jgi:atypical dual specificity phosphatase
MAWMLINFSWLEEGRLAAMGLPDPAGWEELANRGVGAVLSLTEHPAGLVAARRGLRFEHVALEDFGTPRLEDLDRCVAFLDACLAEGRAVVVHCFAGRGRTGTVLAAWYTAKGMGADDAVRHVRHLRPGSVETLGQEEAVRAYERHRRDGRA